MEWASAAFATLWTLIAGASGVWLWTAPDRWRRNRKVNLFGFTMDIDADRTGTRIWLASHKLVGVIALSMAVLGVILTVGFIWQAISGFVQ